MAGLEFRGEVPFHTVVIHGTVRVEGGQKMSKSLGNIIDPLEIIDEMGADALRFSLMMLAATDVYLSRQKFEMGRNFTNKIWNAFRFSVTNLSDFDLTAYRSIENIPATEFSVVDKWILTELENAKAEMKQHLETFRLNEAANTIYHFFWHSFCDWYLELAKPVLAGSDRTKKEIVQNILIHILDNSMRLLHPFLPFITEELWQHLQSFIGRSEGKTVMLTSWPVGNSKLIFEAEANETRMFQEAVSGIRDLRTCLGLKPAEELQHAIIIPKSEEKRKLFQAHYLSKIGQLCRVKEIQLATEGFKERGMIGRVYSHVEVFVTGLSEEEVKRELDKTKQKISELEKLIQGIDGRLSNEGFVSKAPGEVIEKEKERRVNFEKELAAHRENLTLFQT